MTVAAFSGKPDKPRNRAPSVGDLTAPRSVRFDAAGTGERRQVRAVRGRRRRRRGSHGREVSGGDAVKVLVSRRPLDVWCRCRQHGVRCGRRVRERHVRRPGSRWEVLPEPLSLEREPRGLVPRGVRLRRHYRVGRRRLGRAGRRVVRSRGTRGTPAGRLGGQFSLSRVALQVTHEAQPERVLQVDAFDGHQVTCHFAGAFAEAHGVVVHGKLVRIERKRIHTFGVQHLKVVHRHLEDFGFLELGGSLLFECRGYEPTKFGQRRVNPITPPLLDDLQQRQKGGRVLGRAPCCSHRCCHVKRSAALKQYL